MAGSFHHVILADGSLRDPNEILSMIDPGGDVVETLEEMYGMLWFMAGWFENHGNMTAPQLIEAARQNYKTGLAISPTVRYPNPKSEEL